jgi:ankyrin repeat protein
VKLLLETGAELESKDIYGWTPLSYAASRGHEAVPKLLLEKGASYGEDELLEGMLKKIPGCAKLYCSNVEIVV